MNIIYFLYYIYEYTVPALASRHPRTGRPPIPNFKIVFHNKYLQISCNSLALLFGTPRTYVDIVLYFSDDKKKLF